MYFVFETQLVFCIFKRNSQNDQNYIIDTPPKITEAANSLLLGLISEKSRNNYGMLYKTFKQLFK